MRSQDWPIILARKIEEAEHEPFEWGVNDCCLWVAFIIEAMTGIDYAKDFRDIKYAEKDIKELLNNKSLKVTIVSILGNPININFAKRGDVVLGSFKNRETLGICIGEKTAFKSPKGLHQVPTLSCECAWRIN